MVRILMRFERAQLEVEYRQLLVDQIKDGLLIRLAAGRKKLEALQVSSAGSEPIRVFHIDRLLAALRPDVNTCDDRRVVMSLLRAAKVSLMLHVLAV